MQKRQTCLSGYAEMQLILYKDNANRAQKRQTRLSGYAEMQLILYKDKANRAQKRQTCLSGYAEMQLILYKDTANREQKRQTRLSGYAEMQLILYKDTANRAKEKTHCHMLPPLRINHPFTNAHFLTKRKIFAKTVCMLTFIRIFAPKFPRGERVPLFCRKSAGAFLRRMPKKALSMNYNLFE